jgi:hypothetical protein
MPDRDPKSSSSTDINAAMTDATALPEQLPGNSRRQAVYSFLGDAYQVWWSIDAWLRLIDADEVIYLEGAEDFDLVGPDAATTVQVRRTKETISLGAAKALTALENFWALSSQEVHRRIQFYYLTTSPVATEQGLNFGGFKGIEVWRAARTNADLAVQVSKFLLTKLDAGSPIRLFLSSASPDAIQERLIRPFYWLTDQPDLEAVKKSVDDRITVLLSDLHHPLGIAPNVRKNLESRFGEILLERSSARRCLTRAELLRQVDSAATAYVPVPVGQLSHMISAARPGFALLNILLEKVPMPPEPLLRRPALAQRLEELVAHRKVVLLTGTVYKGKTTVAQLVSSTLCPEAWWVSLTGREPAEADNLFLALAGRIDSEGCPSLIIIDDLDISPAAHRNYRDSLALLMHRAGVGGRGILLTARGASSESAIIQDFASIELLDVPEISPDETEALCMEHGCPSEISAIWGFLISTWAKGHPKLVQVRLAEVAANGWPQPGVTDLTGQSPAATSARQMARQLLSSTVPPPVAEFVYLVSECSLPIDRPTSIRLTECVQGLTNGGDILDGLAGRWLERIEGQWYRATALLSGVAAEVWSVERRKAAHALLHDVLLAKHVLSPSEAAALLFHAYIAGDPGRLALTAMNLQDVKDKEAQRQIDRQLFWLPAVALEAGQSITDDPIVEAILRNLQFHVASELDADTLPQICARWTEDVEKITIPQAKSLNQAMMSLIIGFAESTKVPLRYRLNAIMGIQLPPVEILEELNYFGKRFFEEANVVADLPRSGTTTQAMFLNASRCVRGLGALRELLLWLDNAAMEEVRQQFDAMLEWPMTQSMGAFVQGAWASVHEQTEDWEPWIVLMDDADDYAKRRNSPRFGREAAKAKATILIEHLDRAPDALKVLELAETAFGRSAVLTEQRANLFFYIEKDESVLEIWDELTGAPDRKAILNPYAYRRAGMSAARLKRWDKAQEIFVAAADSIQQGFEIVKVGLQVDAALSASLGGRQTEAAMLLADAALSLPPEAANEGDGRWEALQRVAVAVCRIIESNLWKQETTEVKFDPGHASAPDLAVSNPQPGQTARSEMTRGQILRLAATAEKDASKLAKELRTLASSRYFIARWIAAEGLVASAYSSGAGHGFIEALLALETNTLNLQAKREQHQSLLDPDDGPEITLPATPERWFGLLCAGVICTGSDLLPKLKIWLEASSRLLGEDAALTNNIRLLLEGASLPADRLQSNFFFFDSTLSPAFRSGAAAQSLLSVLPAETVLALQAFTTSALVSDGSAIRQSLFNLHVARCFARIWRSYEHSAFQFYAPRSSLPILLATLDEVENGSATLRSVLLAAAAALGQPLGEFMERVW